MDRGKGYSLDELYQALREPEIVRTVWRETSRTLDAPALARLVLDHPLKPRIDGIVGEWFSWSRRRQQKFCKTLSEEGLLERSHIIAYVRWVRGRAPGTMGEVLVAFGRGEGGGGRTRLTRDMSGKDYVNSHAIKLPDGRLYPLGVLMAQIAEIEELRGWWAKKQRYGAMDSHPWLVDGMRQLAQRMGLNLRVVGLSRGE